MSTGVVCNILYMSLLRVYVYQVNRNIWVWCVCCLWGVVVIIVVGVFKLHGNLFCVNGWNLVFFDFV